MSKTNKQTKLSKPITPSKQNKTCLMTLCNSRKEQPRHLTNTIGSYQSARSRMFQVSEQLQNSCVMSHILSFLTCQDQIKYQQLNKFFYTVQSRSFMQSYPLRSHKRRLHLLNLDYIILFDFEQMVKQKYRIKDQIPLWNHQSIEIRGKIYCTGGALANSKTYLKRCSVLDETKMCFVDITPMNYERDAHGICSWQDRYIICVGSWHGPGSRTCEMYDVQTDQWTDLPMLNDGTCAPGLCVIESKLYKLGGTSDIGKVEMLDLQTPKRWVTISTNNKYGRKHTINRCLLHPLTPQLHNRQEDEGGFLVLGCHFGRGEKPFSYDLMQNNYQQFQEEELYIDMYRSNDVIQFSDKSICIRPFVKVGRKAESVKCYQYFLEDCNYTEQQMKLSEPQEDYGMDDGPRRQLSSTAIKIETPRPQNTGLLSRLQTLFSGNQKQKTADQSQVKRGALMEIQFKQGVWHNTDE